jgi:hypothetical protein
VTELRYSHINFFCHHQICLASVFLKHFLLIDANN